MSRMLVMVYGLFCRIMGFRLILIGSSVLLCWWVLSLRFMFIVREWGLFWKFWWYLMCEVCWCFGRSCLTCWSIRLARSKLNRVRVWWLVIMIILLWSMIMVLLGVVFSSRFVSWFLRLVVDVTCSVVSVIWYFYVVW